MRRILATLVLALSMLAAGFYAQDKPAPTTSSKGFDMMSCDPESFVAGYVTFVGKDLKIESISPGPGQVEKSIDDGTNYYKFVSEDKVGFLYERQVGKEKYQVVINYEKKIGFFAVDGKHEAIVFIMADEDGSKLAENAIKGFKVCVDALKDADQPPQMKNTSKT